MDEQQSQSAAEVVDANNPQPDAAETQEPQAEPAPEPTAEQKQAEEKFAAKFAALTRKEKAIRQRETQVQQQMQKLEERLKQVEAQAKEVEAYKSIPERIKKDPFKLMQEHGLTKEQLLEMTLNDGQPTQDMVLGEVEKKFMSKLEEMEKKLAEKEENARKEKEAAAIQQFQAQLTDFVNKTEDYDLIRANDAVDLVYQVIEEHYNETQQILSNKEACDAVENYLLEEAKKLVDRDKVKKLLQTPATTTAPQGARKSSPTLSNAQAAQAPKSTGRKLSDEESKAEAAKLLKWMD